MTSMFTLIRNIITGGGLEIAPYTVTRIAEGYEERLYPARKWVKTQHMEISKDAATSIMFRRLFNYISGQNDKQTKIAMTAPVSVLIEPGSGPNCESTFSMAFYVPATFQEETPVPTNPDVSIEERPEFKVFARAFQGPADDLAFVEQARIFGELIQANKDSTGVDFDSYFSIQYFTGDFDTKLPYEEIWFRKVYGGFSNDQVTEREHAALWTSLADEDKKNADQTAPYYFAGYDAPFKLFFRRNEIWIPLK